MNADQARNSVVAAIDSDCSNNDDQISKHTEALTQDLLALVSGGDIIICW